VITPAPDCCNARPMPTCAGVPNRLRWPLSLPMRRQAADRTAQSIYLPAGSGCFAATVIGGMTQTGKTRIYARCRTFVPATWLKPDQRPLPRAADVENTVALSLWGWHGGGDRCWHEPSRHHRVAGVAVHLTSSNSPSHTMSEIHRLADVERTCQNRRE
jgi:hypothetical protein